MICELCGKKMTSSIGYFPVYNCECGNSQIKDIKDKVDMNGI